MRRLFVAIAISDKIKEEMQKFRKEMADLPVRWLALNDLHITLVPPFYAVNVDIVKKQLRRVKYDKFCRICFQNISFGPNSRQPRLIWACGEAPKALLKIKKQVDRVFSIKEKRNFKLHLTLARFKISDYKLFAKKKIYKEIYWEQVVEKIVLMESFLNNKEARYEVLDEI
jgi:2'-5' RNA ligase